jgi:hypothetical protein
LAPIESDGATQEVAVEWVVGCDGVHSATRELSGIELVGHDIAEPWAVFDVTLGGWSQPYEAIYVYLDQLPVILTALPGRRWRVYLRPSGPDSDLVADAMPTVQRYDPSVVFEAVENPMRFHCHTKVARRFRSGRILLAGDAAHVCSPFQGHGMNTGIQDAFNLAWKLALLCQGHATAGILDSYEAERRPVAERIAASGDEVEHAQTLSDPAERRTRDRHLRAVFADPRARHHEAIAEAELDIDYGKSPIVLGDTHPGLGPGQRLPDTIEARLASGAACGLHEFAHRAGHTALLVGGAASRDHDLVRLADSIRSRCDKALVEATMVLTTRSGNSHQWAALAPNAAEQLGIADVSLFVVRPDGHVGLRADHDHLEALAAYHARLASGPSSA